MKRRDIRASRSRRVISALLGILVFVVGQVSAPAARMLNIAPDQNAEVVARAIADALPHDTLVFGAGLYPVHNVDITIPMTVLGEGEAIFDGGGSGEVLRVMADDVTIRGLTIRGAGVSFIDDNAGLRIEKVRRCTVEHCRFESNFFGIYLAQSADCRLFANTIIGHASTETRSGNGIHLWYCRDVVVDSNVVSGQRDGVYFEFVRSSHITRNTSVRNLRYGLHFMFSDSCLYEGNLFRDNGAGVAVMYTRHVTMLNNTFELNWGASSYGLLLKDITDSEVRGNRFDQNTVGIHLEGSNRIIIRDNVLTRNGWGIRLMASAIDDTITHNDFIGNSIAVTTNSRSSFSTFRENYWSDYNGYDLDGDGFGDVPFRPVGVFSLVVQQHPPAMVLLRSLLVDVLDLAERVVPTLTPATLIDERPVMEPIL